MKLLFYTLALFCVANLVGCGSKTTNGDIPTLNIEAAIDNPRAISLSDLADDVRFIPLDDSSNEALVGDIYEIEESQERFYVRERGDRPVKAFGKDGTFHSTIGSIGRGPAEYLIVENIAVDYSNDKVYVLTSEDNVKVYDESGRMVARKDSIEWGNDASYYKDQLIIMGQSPDFNPEHPDRMPLLEVFSPSLQSQGHIEFPYKGNSRAIIGSVETGFAALPIGRVMSNNGNSLLSKEGRSDTVFNFSNMSIAPAYKLEMGNYTIPDELFEKPASWEEWEKYCMIEQMYEGTRYVVVEAGISRELNYLVFDKRDSSGGFMVVGADGKPGILVGGVAFRPMYIRDNRLVGYMQAIDIVDNAAAITNSDLKTLAATLREDSNPVIVVATLKE
jgi:hypothetical protein